MEWFSSGLEIYTHKRKHRGGNLLKTYRAETKTPLDRSLINFQLLRDFDYWPRGGSTIILQRRVTLKHGMVEDRNE